jgi:DNA invertase Pin-like site-specific DNA recombinase
MEKNKQIQKWAKYRRKSTEADDRQAASLESQDRELDELAGRDGTIVSEEFNFSEAHSAKHAGKRPVFNHLLDLIERGKVNSLLAWSANRISRNAIDAAQVVDLMDRGKLLEVRTPSQSFRNTPQDKFMLALFCMQGKLENDNKGVDVVRGLKNKAIGGGRSGPAPLGYKNFTNERGQKSIVPDPERFHIIRKMWTLMLTGDHSVAEIMRIVNDDMGLRTPKRKNGSGAKKLTKSLAYYILVRPFYCGEFEFPLGSNNHYKGTHVPMITREEFDRVQILLGRKGRPRPKTREFVYRGPITCGECKGSVTAEEKHHCVCSNCKHKFSYSHRTDCPKCATDMENMKNPVTRDYILYHCAKRTNPNCTQGCINQDELERQLEKELAKLEISPKFKGWALDVLKRQNANESADREMIMKIQRKDYDAVVEKIDNLIDMRAGNEIDEDEYRRKKAVLLAEKARVYALLGDTDKRIENWIEVAERGFNFAETACERFNADKSEDLHVRKEVFATLGSNYTLRDKKISIEADDLLFAIKSVKEESLVGINAFEPTQKGSTATQMEPSYVLSPNLLRD